MDDVRCGLNEVASAVKPRHDKGNCYACVAGGLNEVASAVKPRQRGDPSASH